MKTKKIFMATLLVAFGAINESVAQGNYQVPAGTNVGSNNTHVGVDAGSNSSTESGSNTFIGSSAGSHNTSGSMNVFLGRSSGTSNTIGGSNVFIGFDSAMSNTTGSSNTMVGPFSGYNNTEGSNNCFFGNASGIDLIKGDLNTFIGFRTGTGVTYGNYNTFLGTVLSNNPLIRNSIILADGDANQRFYIHENGYAGIGLGNNVIPNNRLEIKHGTANNSGLRLTNLPNTATSIANPTNKILSVNVSGDVILVDDKQGSGTDTSIYANDGTLATKRIVTMGNNNLIFNTSGNTTTTGGRIYIGNTTSFTTANFPTTTGDYRLYVEGGVLTEKVKVAVRTTANWADYVFANDYKLMPLSEVETFVKTNKHLPGISSADKLVNEGLDLGEMQAKQMEKIEELTLYAIEQNKKIEKQEKEIEELKVLVKTLVNKNK